MNNSELKEMEAIVGESVVDDLGIDIEVTAEPNRAPKPVVPIGLAGRGGPDSFDNARPRPTIWHEGEATAMNLNRHIGLTLRPAVRKKLDELVGKAYVDIKPVLDAMLEVKEIDEVQTRRIAQPVPAEAEPGTVFVIINTDGTVNSVHMG